MEDFNYYCNLHGSDKGDIAPNGNHYAKWYEHWFAPLRHSATQICEVGVANGGSLKASHDYFPNAHIIGLDIVDKSAYNSERISTRLFDQGNLAQLEQFVAECRERGLQFDLIIDDGSHDVMHQQLTFGKLFQLVRPGGIYVLEDMGSSYFALGTSLYGYVQTQTKMNNHTVAFLNQRPFSSPWISEQDAAYINEHVSYVSLFDKMIRTLTYVNQFPCVNNYPIRAITSVIQKV